MKDKGCVMRNETKDVLWDILLLLLKPITWMFNVTYGVILELPIRYIIIYIFGLGFIIQCGIYALILPIPFAYLLKFIASSMVRLSEDYERYKVSANEK